MPKLRIKKQAILTLTVLFTITQKWRSRDPDPSFIDLNNNGDNSNLSIGRSASSRTEWTDADEISSLKQEAHQTSRPQSTPFRPVRWIVGLCTWSWLRRTGTGRQQRSRCLPEQHRAAEPHHSGTARSPKQGIEWGRRIVREDENLVDLLCP